MPSFNTPFASGNSGIKVIAGKEHTGLRSNFVQIPGAMTGAELAM